MTASVLVLGLALVAAGDAAPETAADAVTLRDGKVVLGQLVEHATRGPLAIIVRRAWAEAKVPELLRRWEAEERPEMKRAVKQRRDRLAAWKRERSVSVEPEDRINAWIEQELKRLDAEAEPARPPLLVVKLNRSEVRGMVQRPKTSARWLRQGWRSRFPNPETMSLESLKSALEGRGFDLTSTAPVAIDDLLPIPRETDDQWTARRAATEVSIDSGLKFIRVGPIIIPEPTPGRPVDPALALGGLPDLSKLLDGGMPDSLPEKLRAVAARGRVGALVTRQDMSPGLDAALVEIAFWVRRADGRWVLYGTRSATVRTADIKDDEVKALADDEQVQMVFSVVKSFGLGGDLAKEVKQTGLNMGAATQKALKQAREAIQNDLTTLELPIEAPH